MNSLYELTRLITRNKLKKVILLGQSGNEDTLIDTLYDYILNNPGKSEKEIAEHIYGDSNSLKQFRKLKSKLKYRLIDHIFIIDDKKPTQDTIESASTHCWREWAAVKILLHKECNLCAIDLAEKLLGQAITYELVDLVLAISRTLRAYYTTYIGDTSKFHYYNNLYREYERYYQLEVQAEEYRQLLIIQLVNSKSNKEEVGQLASEYYRQLEPHLSSCSLFAFQRYARFIQLIAHMNRFDYEGSIRICEDAITFIEQKPFVSRAYIAMFLYQQIACFIQLQQYDRGREAILRGEQMEKVGSYNWFKLRELHLLLGFHSANYQNAYEIYTDTIKHAKFSAQPPIVAETWKIYEAYLYYLFYLKLIIPAEDDVVFSKFRQAKFMNEVPIFSKDKRGMNIPILILQIIFNIAQKKYARAIDRIEAIEKYCARYVRRNEHYRSNNFIRMLLLIPQHNFHQAAVTRHCQRYLNNIRKVPIEMAAQSHEIEIIPYETLWKLTLSTLKMELYWPAKRRKRKCL